MSALSPIKWIALSTLVLASLHWQKARLEDQAIGASLNGTLKQLFDASDQHERFIPRLIWKYLEEVPLSKTFQRRSRDVLEANGRHLGPNADLWITTKRLLVPLVELILDKSRLELEDNGDQFCSECPASRQLDMNSVLDSCCRCLVPGHCKPSEAGQCPPGPSCPPCPSSEEQTPAFRMRRRRRRRQANTNGTRKDNYQPLDGLKLFKTNLRLLVKDPTLRQELVGAFDSLPSRVDGHHWPRAIELLAYLGDQVDEPEWNGGSTSKTSSNNSSDKPGVRFTRLCSRRNTKALVGHLLERFRRSLLGPSRCKQCRLNKVLGGHLNVSASSSLGEQSDSRLAVGCSSVPCPACSPVVCPLVNAQCSNDQSCPPCDTVYGPLVIVDEEDDGDDDKSSRASSPAPLDNSASDTVNEGSRSGSFQRSSFECGLAPFNAPKTRSLAQKAGSRSSGLPGRQNKNKGEGKGKGNKNKKKSNTKTTHAPALQKGNATAAANLFTGRPIVPLGRPTEPRVLPPETNATAPAAHAPADNSTGYVVAGRRTRFSFFPQYVHMNFWRTNGQGHSCGGVIVGPRQVLTAAHCVNQDNPFEDILPANMRVTVKSDEPGRRDQHFTASRACYLRRHYTHLYYGGLTYDTALVTLSRDLHFDNYIQPACLPVEEPSYKECYLVGLGYRGYRRPSQGADPIPADGFRGINVVRRSCADRGFKDTDQSRICFGPGPNYPGGSSCSGDSGGPVLCLENQRWTVVATVSYSWVGCKGPIQSDIYAYVHRLLPLLRKQCGL